MNPAGIRPSNEPDSCPRNPRSTLRAACLVIEVFAGSGVLFWAFRAAIWESGHPALQSARAIRSGDPNRRLAAIEELGSSGLEDESIAVAALTNGLKDKDVRVRASAARSLGRLLGRTTGSGTEAATVRAAIKALLGLLRDERSAVRAASANALAELHWASLPPVATGASESAIREQIATLTLPVDPSDAIASLAQALTDRDAEVRAAAVHSMGTIAPQVPYYHQNAAGLSARENSTDTGASATANRRSTVDFVIPILLELLERDEPEVRAACNVALARIGPPGMTAASVPTLIAGLTSSEHAVEIRAAALLARLGTKAKPGLGALLSILNQPVPAPRTEPDHSDWSGGDPACMAALAVGAIAPNTDEAARAAAALLELVGSQSAARRRAAVKSLAFFNPDERVIAALTAALRDQDPKVRRSAIRGWALVVRKASIAPPGAFRDALKDVDLGNRKAAAETLRSFDHGLDPLIPTLLAGLGESNSGVREACLACLESLDPGVVTAATVPVLARALDSRNPLIRREASALLAKLGSSTDTTLAKLIRVTALEVEETAVSGWGLSPSEALGQLAPGTPSSALAIATLRRVLQSKHRCRRGEAARALAHFGTVATATTADLIRLLNDSADAGDSAGWNSAAHAIVRVAPSTRVADEAWAALAQSLRASRTRIPHHIVLADVWRFGPTDQVVSVLIEAINAGYADLELASAINSLAQMGPKAREAIPKLRSLRDDPRNNVRVAAGNALAAIGDDERKSP
jgi:HEAT repeat protein